MAKKRNKIQSKYLNTALGLRKHRNKQGIIALVSLGAALVIFVVYYFLVSNAILNLAGVTSLFVWLFFAILAAIVGLYTNRYSRASTAYKRYLRENDIPEEEVKRYAQTHRS